MIDSFLRGAIPDSLFYSTKSFKRLTGFDPTSQARSSRAKTKPGGVRGSVNSSAIHASEDEIRPRVAAGRADSGSVDRTQAATMRHKRHQRSRGWARWVA